MKDGWKEVKVYIKDEGKEKVETPKEVFQKLYHLAKKYNCRFSEIDKVFELNNDLSDKDLRTVIEEFEHWNNILKIHLYTDFKLSRFIPEEEDKETQEEGNPYFRDYIGNDVFELKKLKITIASNIELLIKINKKRECKLTYDELGLTDTDFDTLKNLRFNIVTASDSTIRQQVRRLNKRLKKEFSRSENFIELDKTSEPHRYITNFVLDDCLYIPKNPKIL